MTPREKLAGEIFEVEQQHDLALKKARLLQTWGDAGNYRDVLDDLKYLTAKHGTMMAEYRSMEG